MDPRSEETQTLQFRLRARATQIALLRAQLRLWLLASHVGDEQDAGDILAAATRAFVTALQRPGGVRTLVVEVEARYADGIVDVSLHDHAGPGGNTIRFRRLLEPVRAQAAVSRS